MTIKERIEVAAKAYGSGYQNKYRTFLAGTDFYKNEVIQMLTDRRVEYFNDFNASKRESERSYYASRMSLLDILIHELKSEL